MDIPKEQIEIIVKILKDNEGGLSDGYEYYCGRKNSVDKALKEIAIEIITNLNSLKKEVS